MTNSVATPDFGRNRATRSLSDVDLFTRRYIKLRGLEFAPVSCAAMLMFLAAGVGWLHPERGDVMAVPILLAVAGVAAWLIHRYLDRTFGVVRPLRQHKNWWGFLPFMVMFVTFLVLQFNDASARLHFDFGGLYFGLWAAGHFAVRDRGFRGHWLIPAATGVLLPFLIPYSTPHTRLAFLAWAAFWATFLFAQLWDHRLLVRGPGHGRA